MNDSRSLACLDQSSPFLQSLSLAVLVLPHQTKFCTRIYTCLWTVFTVVLGISRRHNSSISTFFVASPFSFFLVFYSLIICGLSCAFQFFLAPYFSVSDIYLVSSSFQPNYFVLKSKSLHDISFKMTN